MMVRTKTFLKFLKKEKALAMIFVLFASGISVRYSTISIPEIIPGGHEFGNVFHALGLGYFITYVFYYLVVFVKRESDLNNVNEFLSFNSSRLVGDGYGFLNSMKQEARMLKSKIDLAPSEEQTKLLWNKINLDKAPLTIGTKKANWMEYIQHVQRQSEAPLKKIFELLPYMDSELTKLSYELRESSLFYHATHLVIPKGSLNEKESIRTTLLKPIHDYFKLIKELETYTERNFSEFEKHKKIRNPNL